jgi:hypothetical protein
MCMLGRLEASANTLLGQPAFLQPDTNADEPPRHVVLHRPVELGVERGGNKYKAASLVFMASARPRTWHSICYYMDTLEHNICLSAVHQYYGVSISVFSHAKYYRLYRMIAI